LSIVANQLGAIALKAGSFERAESLLTKSLDKLNDALPYSHLLYNLGNLFMAKKDHLKALLFYSRALKASPYRHCNSFRLEVDLTNSKFNS
jgi:tetratricopeptide (TPR) repeat protein